MGEGRRRSTAVNVVLLHEDGKERFIVQDDNEEHDNDEQTNQTSPNSSEDSNVMDTTHQSHQELLDIFAEENQHHEEDENNEFDLQNTDFAGTDLDKPPASDSTHHTSDWSLALSALWVIKMRHSKRISEKKVLNPRTVDQQANNSTAVWHENDKNQPSGDTMESKYNHLSALSSDEEEDDDDDDDEDDDDDDDGDDGDDDDDDDDGDGNDGNDGDVEYDIDIYKGCDDNYVKSNCKSGNKKRDHEKKTKTKKRERSDPLKTTIDIFTKRRSRESNVLRYHPSVIAAINDLWMLEDIQSELDKDGLLGKNAYVMLLVKFQYLIIPPPLKSSKANRNAEIDWNNDSKRNGGHPSGRMTKSMFEDSMFELADTWSEQADASEYVQILEHLLLGVSAEASGQESDSDSESDLTTTTVESNNNLSGSLCPAESTTFLQNKQRQDLGNLSEHQPLGIGKVSTKEAYDVQDNTQNHDARSSQSNVSFPQNIIPVSTSFAEFGQSQQLFSPDKLSNDQINQSIGVSTPPGSRSAICDPADRIFHISQPSLSSNEGRTTVDSANGQAQYESVDSRANKKADISLKMSENIATEGFDSSRAIQGKSSTLTVSTLGPQPCSLQVFKGTTHEETKSIEILSSLDSSVVRSMSSLHVLSADSATIGDVTSVHGDTSRSFKSYRNSSRSFKNHRKDINSSKPVRSLQPPRRRRLIKNNKLIKYNPLFARMAQHKFEGFKTLLDSRLKFKRINLLSRANALAAIGRLYQAKYTSDQKNIEKGLPRSRFDKFIFEQYVLQFGSRKMAKRNLKRLFGSVRHFADRGDAAMRLFAILCGIEISPSRHELCIQNYDPYLASDYFLPTLVRLLDGDSKLANVFSSSKNQGRSLAATTVPTSKQGVFLTLALTFQLTTADVCRHTPPESTAFTELIQDLKSLRNHIRDGISKMDKSLQMKQGRNLIMRMSGSVIEALGQRGLTTSLEQGLLVDLHQAMLHAVPVWVADRTWTTLYKFVVAAKTAAKWHVLVHKGVPPNVQVLSQIILKGSRIAYDTLYAVVAIKASANVIEGLSGENIWMYLSPSAIRESRSEGDGDEAKKSTNRGSAVKRSATDGGQRHSLLFKDSPRTPRKLLEEARRLDASLNPHEVDGNIL